MSDLHVTCHAYQRKIEELAFILQDDGYNFNQIVCIARGGLRPGDILGRIFDVPLAILSAESYSGQERGQIVFSRDLTKTTPGIGSRVLLVDDLVDSGVTFRKSLEWLEHYYGFYIDTIKTACMWYKAGSSFRPDYFVTYLEDNPWIHMPFEKYELKGIEEIEPTI